MIFPRPAPSASASGVPALLLQAPPLPLSPSLLSPNCRPANDAKRAYGARLVSYINKYSSAFVVECDNVGSKQMQNIRVALRGTADVIMGKNVSSQGDVDGWMDGVGCGKAGGMGE